jgi:hypothetical protein
MTNEKKSAFDTDRLYQAPLAVARTLYGATREVTAFVFRSVDKASKQSTGL